MTFDQVPAVRNFVAWLQSVELLCTSDLGFDVGSYITLGLHYLEIMLWSDHSVRARPSRMPWQIIALKDPCVDVSFAIRHPTLVVGKETLSTGVVVVT